MAVLPTRRPTERTAKKDARFLSALCLGLSVSHAAREAGYRRQAVYEYRQRDELFAAAWDDAIQEGVDHLEDEARRRAVDGVEDPVYHQGSLVGSTRRYSDTLLIFLLKGRNPEKYAERHQSQVTMTGKIDTTWTWEIYKPDG